MDDLGAEEDPGIDEDSGADEDPGTRAGGIGGCSGAA